MKIGFTAYGAVSLSVLRREVAAGKADDAMSPLTVIVPNNLAGIVARRHFATGLGGARQGIAAVDVTTIERFAERLAGLALAPRRPVTAPILAAAWRKALATEPGVFAEVANHSATIQALVAAYRTLRDADTAALATIDQAGGLAAEVVRLHRSVHNSLRTDWYDVVDLLEAATSRAGKADLGAVIFYLPQNLSRGQAALATALSVNRAHSTVICGLTGVHRADSAVGRWIAKSVVAVPPASKPVTATRVLNASDSDDEVRCVVREVVEALKTIPAHRIAVLYPATKPYARLLHEQLAAAGITVNGTGPRPVVERSIARTFLGLLALPDSHVGRADLFRALAGAPVRDFNGDRVPLSRWERTSRSAGVVGGEDWTLRLSRLIEIETAEIVEQEKADDSQAWRVERSRQAIVSAEGLNAFVTRLLSELDQADHLSTWRQLVDWATQLFETLLGRTDTLAKLPPEEQYGAAAVTSTLQELGNLDSVDATPTLSGLREALELALSSSLPRVGRFGDGIFVGPISSAVGLDLDVVFVVGLSEDLYPGRVHEDALLPERVRAVSLGQLPSARDALDRQHRNLLVAFAAAPTALASFPRGDLRRSTVRIPSRFLLPTLRQLSGDGALAATAWEGADYAGAMSTSGSFAGELLHTAALSQEQEWRTREAVALGMSEDPVVRAGRVMIQARADHSLSRFDGNLTGLAGIPDYAAGLTPISPTALESYAVCPHAFFVRRLLGVEPIEQPEDIVTISPAQIGTFVHAVMDRLIGNCHDALPDYGEPWSAGQRVQLREIAKTQAEALAQVGLTGHPRLWEGERKRILTDLQWMLDDDDSWRGQERARVLASEMPFGMRGHSPVKVTVPRGTVLMRGSADRVDERADGTLIVTDIKTGSRRTFKKISEADPFIEGTKLQLPVYALAARSRFGDASKPVRSAYWFVRKDRGRIELPLSSAVEQGYVETVSVLVDSIAAGLFPPKAPETPDFAWVQCAYCNPDGTGYGELRDSWERKQYDPALRRLIRLIDVDAPASLADDGPPL